MADSENVGVAGRPNPRKGAAKLVRYFGKRPGQTVGEFKKELDELTDEDYRQLVEGIENETFTY